MFVKGAKMGRRLGSQEGNQARHTNGQILPCFLGANILPVGMCEFAVIGFF